MEKFVTEIVVSLGAEALKRATPVIVKGLFRKVTLSIQGNVILSFNSLMPLDDAQILLEEILKPIRRKKNGLRFLKYETYSFSTIFQFAMNLSS